MGRPPSDNPRSEKVSVKLTVSEREMLDRRRGSRSLSDYIRARALGRK